MLCGKLGVKRERKVKTKTNSREIERPNEECLVLKEYREFIESSGWQDGLLNDLQKYTAPNCKQPSYGAFTDLGNKVMSLGVLTMGV